MSKRKKHNPEKRAFKGRSYKKGGKRVKALKEKTFLVTLRRRVIETMTVKVKARDMAHAEELAFDKADDIGENDGDDWEYWDSGIETNEISEEK